MSEEEETEARPAGPDTGSQGVAAMIADAEEADAFTEQYTQGRMSDPVPGGDRNGVLPGQWTPGEDGLPPDCPVAPLGTADGRFFFLNTIGEFRAIPESQMGQATINSLFMGRQQYMYWAWPQFNKKEQVEGFKAHKARESLMEAAGYKGTFDPASQMRGRGAWTAPDGNLILHCGNALIEHGKVSPLGEIGGRVYATRPPIQKPWPKPLTNLRGPAMDLLPLLRQWNWERPEVDPVLLLGSIGAGIIGGALDYRPAAFIVGDKATGKSTLQQILKLLLGGWLIKSANTTAAGIYQQLQFDSLPVAIDEFEATADSRRAKAILELARQAFSGDVMFRGGESHKGIQFNARSSFLFSAINTPPLDPQDLSRQAILVLRRLPQGQAPPVLDAKKLQRLGRMCMRRMVDNWHRFPATLQAYYEAMATAGHDGRGQNTFGTLLACADLLIDCDGSTLGIAMGDNGEDLRRWGELLTPSQMLEYEGADENWRRCMDHILSARVDAWKGGSRNTIGRILDRLWNDTGSPEPFEERMDFSRARDLLQEAGLSLARPAERSADFKLFVPNNNPLLHQLFQGSKWQGTVDAGSWMVALRQAPEGFYELGSARINGVKSKGTLFRLADILGLEPEGSEDD